MSRLVRNTLLCVIIFAALLLPLYVDASVQLIDWYGDNGIYYLDKTDGVWHDGEIAMVTDFATGISFQAVRYRGTKHADWEPATVEDTASLLDIYGDEWSWDRRGVTIEINEHMFAASINGQPHGTSSIDDNGCRGHFCMHFAGSKTHGGNRVDKKHQEQIQWVLGVEPSQ